jgi:hypothetical protein
MSRGLASLLCGLSRIFAKELNMKRIILVALVTAGCGGSAHTALDQNRAGTGTASLKVTADATATNAVTPTTSLAVDVTDGLGANVTGATVTIQNAGLGGDVALTESTAGSGHYTSAKTLLPSGDFTLSVVRGTDKVQGVVVGNPGTHAINAPVANTTVTANQPLAVSWTTPTAAKSVTITTRNYSVQAPDTGTYTIPGANNPPRTTSPFQRVILKRANEVEIAGGLPGSIFRVAVTTTVDPFTVQ